MMFGRRPQAEAAVTGTSPNLPQEAPSKKASDPAEGQQSGAGKQVPGIRGTDNVAARNKRVAAAKAVFERIQTGLLERIDASAAAKLPRDELQRQIAELIAEIVSG
jgi:hypothetical protein